MRYFSHLFTLIGILAFCLYLISCTTTRPVATPPKEAFYRSKDYIVYGLQGGETPEQLALRFLGSREMSWVVEEANPDAVFTRGRLIVIPLKDRNKGGLSAEGYQTIPVLTYHRFAGACKSKLCTPAHVFDHQMKYLKENGYRTISPAQLNSFLSYRSSLPKKSVWITMDDGYRSVYDVAYPILKKYGFTATLFVYTDFVGVSKTAITWDQLKKLKAEGFTIGSHTLSHCDLTKRKDEESDRTLTARLIKELKGSKAIIDKRLNQDTDLLAYPFGNFDPRVVRLSAEAGYKIAVSVNRGGNPFFANPLTLRRDQILSRDMDKFTSRLNTFNHLPLEQ